ncbi:MAG: imidazole glycerol phosphate synthase subunit HisH [Candidatus Bathyarchaeia archaeon]
MMPKATIINYGVGNLFSIKCSLERAGFKVGFHPGENVDLRDSDAIVLPGVGNFGAGAKNIEGVKVKLLEAIGDGIPVLGVCLGMQLLFEGSEESPERGLGILGGRVIRLPRGVKIPHMGWNSLSIVKQVSLLEDISVKDLFYFVHSYHAAPKDRDVIAAETEYGTRFPSVIVQGNIFGVQFHPEKSGKPGERILRNFMNAVKR